MVLGTGAFSSKTLVSVALLRHLSDQRADVVPYKAVTVLRDSDLPKSTSTHCLPHHILAGRVTADPHQCPVIVHSTSPHYGDLYVLGEKRASVAVPCKDTVDLRSVPADVREDIVMTVRAGVDRLRDGGRSVVVEGAGSSIALAPEEDLPNIDVARRLRPGIVLVTEFSGGGAAAALIGTFACLPVDIQAMVRGFIVANTPQSRAVDRAVELVEQMSGLTALGMIPSNDALAYDQLYTDNAINGWASALRKNVDLEKLLQPSRSAPQISMEQAEGSTR